MAFVTWFEIGLRWILGLQLMFWGLNGFFHWKPVPRSNDFITRFADACHDSRFILPTVKIFEIIFGALLIAGSGTWIALMMLGPIIFVISGLHLIHNPKPWQVLVPITLPYLLILILNGAAKWELFKSLLLH